MCYVGKATKIFFVVVGVMAVSGLILGFGLLRHSWAHNKVRPCQSNNACHPIFPDPIPANTAAAPIPTTNPSVPTNPTTTTNPPAATNPTASATPTTTTSTAFPPLLSPPSPISAALGPVHS
ncbi:hypothetical protein COCNU_12G003680 [Cocos nucifera]|uniref:Uncharacterized protein n=1 Tax=Cocos nucifera TaxID=13894 RepID=A0A8K0IRW3_COCNU|nr:hypothetical protein COCNU_12G003680 [Cocos nucifera]